MPGQQMGSQKPYLKIVQGNIVQQVDPDTEGARKREWTVDGKRGIVWEKVYINWTGHIRNIYFQNHDFGSVCNIVFDDAILTIPTGKNYFSSFASRFKNIDLTQPVTLHPYKMETPDKVNIGISVQQDGEKLGSYYYDPETKTNKHGYPQVDQKKLEEMGGKYWKGFFTEVEVFLIKELENIDFPEEVVEITEEESNPY